MDSLGCVRCSRVGLFFFLDISVWTVSIVIAVANQHGVPIRRIDCGPCAFDTFAAVRFWNIFSTHTTGQSDNFCFSHVRFSMSLHFLLLFLLGLKCLLNDTRDFWPIVNGPDVSNWQFFFHLSFALLYQAAYLPLPLVKYCFILKRLNLGLLVCIFLGIWFRHHQTWQIGKHV